MQEHGNVVFFVERAGLATWSFVPLLHLAKMRKCDRKSHPCLCTSMQRRFPDLVYSFPDITLKMIGVHTTTRNVWLVPDGSR